MGAKTLAALGIVAVTSLLPLAVARAASDELLRAAIGAPHRSAKFVARDAVRHPFDELSFFGLRPDADVVEIWPGGGYWTEILAPYLQGHGHYAVALERKGPGETAEAGTDSSYAAFRAKLGGDKSLYEAMRVTVLGPGETDIAAPGSADMVLTFRNLHNWMKQGDVDEVLAGFYRALKPGGVLGVEEHRGQRHVTQDPKALDGYVAQDYAIALIKKAGFVFVAASEINANPKDSADWPKGVWTLPPTYALGEQDKAKYAAIGEADNFVLLFKKPEL